MAFSWRPEPLAGAEEALPPGRSRGRPDGVLQLQPPLHRSVCVNQLVGGHPIGRTRPVLATRPAAGSSLQKFAGLPAQPCAPPGRASSRAGWGGSRLYGPRTAPAVWGRSTADSGLQSVQTGGQAADPRQTARQRGAGLQSVPAYTDITMDSVQCLTSPHENPFHFRLHFCIVGKLCQSWVQSGSHCGQ